MIFSFKPNLLKKLILLVLVISLLSAFPISYAFDNLNIDEELNYINVDLHDIFRDLANMGKFRVLFTQPLDKKVSLIINSGTLIKSAISELAANHSLVAKWPDSNTVIIGNNSSSPTLNSANLSSHVLPLKFISPISVSKTLETVVPSSRIQYDLRDNTIKVMSNLLELQNIAKILNRSDRDFSLIKMEIIIYEINSDNLQLIELNEVASPNMKLYPLTEKQLNLIINNPQNTLLAKQEIINLNNQQETVLLGDRIPNISQTVNADSTNYEVEYINAGTTLKYSAKIDSVQSSSLTIQLQAKVTTLNTITNNSAKNFSVTDKRGLNAAVGISPGQTLMLTNALKRDEYLELKSSQAQLPFLNLLFNSTTNKSMANSPVTTTIILLKPYINKTAADSSQPAATDNVQNKTIISNTTNINYIVKKNDNVTSIAKKFKVNISAIINANQLKENEVILSNSTLIIPIPTERIYTVKTDDTLWRLAKRYGTTPQELIELNNLESQAKIEVYQKLVLPVPISEIINPQF